MTATSPISLAPFRKLLPGERYWSIYGCGVGHATPISLQAGEVDPNSAPETPQHSTTPSPIHNTPTPTHHPPPPMFIVLAQAETVLVSNTYSSP